MNFNKDKIDVFIDLSILILAYFTGFVTGLIW